MPPGHSTGLSGCPRSLSSVTKRSCWGVREELLDQAFSELPAIEEEAVARFQEDPMKAIDFLNAYSNGFARSVVDRMWEVGDEIWLKYVSGF